MKWHLLYTRAGCENRVADFLSRKRIECFFPVRNVVTAGGNIKKPGKEPLLPGYLFIKLAEARTGEIKKAPGVINFVYWLNRPLVIDDREVELMRYFLLYHSNIQISKTLPSFDKVPKYNGVHIDKESVDAGKKTVSLALFNLGYTLTAEVEMGVNRLIPVNKDTRPAINREFFQHTA